MFEIYVGCEEWQITTKFDGTLLEALAYVNEMNMNMGLYGATDGWIENLETGEKLIFLSTEE